MTSMQTPNEYDWTTSVNTSHTIETLKTSGEFSEEQTKVMQRIIEARSKYDLDSTEFRAILEYVTSRAGYLNNFTCIEDVYFEFASRLLRKQEMDKWLGDEMYKRLNPTQDKEIGSRLITTLEAMRESGLKGDEMFAMAHKNLNETIIPFKHSSCAVILNTIKPPTVSEPPGAD